MCVGCEEEEAIANKSEHVSRDDRVRYESVRRDDRAPRWEGAGQSLMSMVEMVISCVIRLMTLGYRKMRDLSVWSVYRDDLSAQSRGPLSSHSIVYKHCSKALDMTEHLRMIASKIGVSSLFMKIGFDKYCSHWLQVQ